MEKNSQNFSMEDAMRMARSPGAQQLMELLRAKNPEAMDQAAAGDYGKLKQNLASMLSDPQIWQLLKRLGDGNG